MSYFIPAACGVRISSEQQMKPQLELLSIKRSLELRTAQRREYSELSQRKHVKAETATYR